MKKSLRMVQYTPRNCFSGLITIAITGLPGLELVHSLLQQSEQCCFRMQWHKSQNRSWLRQLIRSKQQGNKIFKLVLSNHRYSSNRIKQWWSRFQTQPCNQLTNPALMKAILIRMRGNAEQSHWQQPL